MTIRRSLALLTATAALVGGFASPAQAAFTDPDAGPRPQGGLPGCYVTAVTAMSYREVCPEPDGWATTYVYRKVAGKWRAVLVWHGRR